MAVPSHTGGGSYEYEQDVEMVTRRGDKTGERMLVVKDVAGIGECMRCEYIHGCIFLSYL